MDTGSLSNLSEEAESIIDFSISHPTGPTVSLYGNLSTERSKKDVQACASHSCNSYTHTAVHVPYRPA